MKYPRFFDNIATIRLRDPLADFLGAADGGIVEYCYLDAVKLAGHSCPTVASAFGLTRQALRALYGEDLPERGGLRIEFAQDIADGVAGVIASVVSLLTGAAGAGGFKGLAGRYQRRELLFFNADIPLELRYTRLDGQGQVDAAAFPGKVPASAEMGALMQRCLSGQGEVSELLRFGELWQDRVRQILIDHGDDPSVFTILRA